MVSVKAAPGVAVSAEEELETCFEVSGANLFSQRLGSWFWGRVFLMSNRFVVCNNVERGAFVVARTVPRAYFPTCCTRAVDASLRALYW